MLIVMYFIKLRDNRDFQFQRFFNVPEVALCFAEFGTSGGSCFSHLEPGLD